MGACNKLLLFKIIETLLTLACLAMHYNSMELYESYTILTVSGTLGGYLVILVGVFAAIILGEPIPRRAWIFYSLAAVGLFVASGVLAIQYQTTSSVQGTFNKVEDAFNKAIGNDQPISRTEKTIGVAKGSVAIINAVAFFFDAVFTFRSAPPV